MKITDKYIFFWHGSFNNWHPAKIIYENIHFSNSEQMFMWFKAITFDDYDTAQKIIDTPDPKSVKALGRKVIGYNEFIWNENRYSAMFKSCLHKFEQNLQIKKELLATKDKILAEASPYDKIWGIGMKETDVNIENESMWKGENLIGKVLMDVRKKL